MTGKSESPNPFRYHALYRSVYHARVRNFNAARKYLDRCPEGVERAYSFVPAYEAVLWVVEKETAKPFERFSQLAESLQEATGDDARYMKLFCDFYVALYLRDPVTLQYKALAEQIRPTGLGAMVLTFPSDDKINVALAENGQTDERGSA